MTVTVRFAPSPTGLMHVGNARAAIVNWLFARSQGGRFMLRIDDTDKERSKPEYEAALRADLLWLELDWQVEARQSDRLSHYEGAAQHLRANGRLYPCYETPEELELKRKTQLNAGRPPIYDRAALKLSTSERQALEAKGIKPHWRLKLNQRALSFDDAIRGPVMIDSATLSDPVLIRADGQFLYTLCSVVDDIDFAITHVIRGEDHVVNTIVQWEIFEALEAKPPHFAHYPLIADAGGDKLSKRAGSLSIQTLRQDYGIEPLALLSFLAKLGTADAIEARTSAEILVREFDLGKFSRGAPKFDLAELQRLNAKLLHQLPFAAVAQRLAKYGAIGEEFWLALRGNLDCLEDIALWWRIANGPVAPVIENPALLEVAGQLFPTDPLQETSWATWTGRVAGATGLKGKALYLPLRQALTGMAHGPELKVLLPFIGRERALARLKGQTQ
jgi:glutamyl-tRNA synthetase